MPDELSTKSLAIKDLLFSRIMMHRYGRVHCYIPLSTKQEVDTRPIIDTLIQDFPSQIFIPKVQKGGELTHHLYDPIIPLKTNQWGIEEPVNEGISSKEFFETDEDILVIVPLLAFDKTGHRVGYGKGFYDRFLRFKQSETLLVGLSFFEALEEPLASEATDIALNHVVTPKRIYGFG